MSGDIQIFNFDEHAVRIVDRDGEPWFVAADVCRLLGLDNTTEALRNLDADERNTLSSAEGIHSGRGNPNVTIISESAVYSLIFVSRKPEAKRVKRWVTHEVLPEIRRTGSYNGSRKTKWSFEKCLNRRDADDVREIQSILISAMRDVVEKKITTGQAQTLVNLAGQFFRPWQLALETWKQGCSEKVPMLSAPE